MLITAVYNQKVFPGAGDVDDCWVVSAIQCARAVAPWVPKGSVPWFRGAANDPDDGASDGGNSRELMLGAQRMWPQVRVVAIDGKDWAWLSARLKASIRPVSLAVMSAAMPVAWRFGFNGPHQITVWYEDGTYWMANPLAPEGSKPIKVTGTGLRAGAYNLTGNSTVRGVIFPTREEAANSRLQYTQPQLTTAVDKAVADLRTTNQNLQIALDKERDKAVKVADVLVAQSTILRSQG